MKRSVVYNVTVKGIFIGLTFDQKEAHSWIKGDPNGRVEARPYRAAK